METTANINEFRTIGDRRALREVGVPASLSPRFTIPAAGAATCCASCGSVTALVEYDSEGWVCFCLECLDGAADLSEWLDLGVCD